MNKKSPKKKSRTHKPETSEADSESDVSLIDADHKGQATSSSSRVLSPHFSPVTVVTSPSSTHRGGQLTGLPRKVKDTCADWHNYIMDWDTLNAKGMQVISEIANLKIKAGSEIDNEDGEGESDLSNVFPSGLEDLCQTMKQVYTSMEKLVIKFRTMTSSLKGVTVLDQSRHEESFTDTQPDLLFQTWPTQLFYETSEQLLDMYERELRLKQKIVQNVAHGRDQNMLMSYTTVWLHQPYIDTDSERLLNGMLLETGLR